MTVPPRESPKTATTTRERATESSSSSSSSSTSPLRPSDRPPYLNNPDAVADVRVDVYAPIHERDAQIEAAVREICPDMFRDGDDDDDGDGDGDDDDDDGEGDASAAAATVTRSLSIYQLGGGLSNHLYVVTAKGKGKGKVKGKNDGVEDSDSDSASVLVRIHGEDDSDRDKNDEDEDDEGAEIGFVDRSVENRILASLSRSGAAPTFYGRFANGRVEEFYDGYRPLRWGEMSDRRYAGGVAEAMARLHRTVMPEGILPTTTTPSSSSCDDDEEGAGGGGG
eukprot:CAMPEP_0113586190 /NCGR_PEP_ID=MMETSP0015_2-20120614/34156_1 /TAXON_ID=2838 /ORGANISM="Odontella" /LENGTH=280 /DNA_ID=CAMNT_0000491593 /DNA_START=67 /DNA_END=905 /DNA_ORIENTATION=+ /assembly_acc=CAM_ASM_000160